MTARAKASDVVASLQTVLLRLHNVTPGMTDYKSTYADARTFILAVEMLNRFDGVMKALRINAPRAMENSTTTDDVDGSRGNIAAPAQCAVRVGHSFASAIVDHAKANNLLPRQFPYAEAVRIFAGAAQKYKQGETKCPLDEATFRKTLSPETWFARASASAARNLRRWPVWLPRRRQALAQDNAWLDERNTKLLEAEAKLNTAFGKLVSN